MGRKTKILETLNLYDAAANTLQQQVITIQQNADLSQEGQMRQINVLRDKVIALAKSTEVRIQDIVNDAREALASKGNSPDGAYQVRLANALKIAELGAANMTPDEVRALIKPFVYDQLAHAALAGAIRKNGTQAAIAAIPQTDLPIIHKYLDGIERCFQARVNGLVKGGGSQWSGVVVNVNRDPFAVDTYSEWIEYNCGFLNEDLTGLAQDI